MTHRLAGGSGAWNEQLRTTLETVDNLYRQIAALGLRLVTGIENGEHDRLLDLLDERGGCVGMLEGIAPAYASGMAAFEQRSSTLTPGERADLSALIAGIQNTAAELAEQDAQTSRLLEGQKRSIASEMSSLGQKSAAVAAYSGGGAAKPAARFQDREG